MPVELARTLVKTRRRRAASIRPFISPASKTVNLSSIVSASIASRTGYDLRHVFNDDMTRFDLTRHLNGVGRGRYALLLKPGWILPPIPKVRRLVNVKYDSFDSALRNNALYG